MFWSTPPVRVPTGGYWIAVSTPHTATRIPHVSRFKRICSDLETFELRANCLINFTDGVVASGQILFSPMKRYGGDMVCYLSGHGRLGPVLQTSILRKSIFNRYRPDRVPVQYRFKWPARWAALSFAIIVGEEDWLSWWTCLSRSNIFRGQTLFW